MDFLLRENIYDCVNKIPMSYVRLAAEDILFEYAVKGTYDINKYPISEQGKKEVTTVLRHLIISIRETQERYQRAVENGRKGGLKGGKLGGRGNKKNNESTQLACQTD